MTVSTGGAGGHQTSDDGHPAERSEGDLEVLDRVVVNGGAVGPDRLTASETGVDGSGLGYCRIEPSGRVSLAPRS
ncbi:hypothetical protein [Knoellia aerolata]|uniref:hypothetical protein n=1 Tax=Knoellia aerolata TaxID=442954 RepID=UPI000AC1B36D|nr:hypothetical protein [Knoellia aerolata]